MADGVAADGPVQYARVRQVFRSYVVVVATPSVHANTYRWRSRGCCTRQYTSRYVTTATTVAVFDRLNIFMQHTAVPWGVGWGRQASMAWAVLVWYRAGACLPFVYAAVCKQRVRSLS